MAEASRMTAKTKGKEKDTEYFYPITYSAYDSLSPTKEDWRLMR
jgi:hypothetical protein